MKSVAKAVVMQSSLGAWLGKVTPMTDLYARAVWAKRMNHYMGLHRSYAKAEAFAARFSSVGWDDETIAELLVDGDETQSVPGKLAPSQISQFAVMLWLTKLLEPGCKVLDLGGAGGVFYETCARYGLLEMPLCWHIVDMPSLVRRGKARHDALNTPAISFGTDLAEAPVCDILLMLGSIQYMRDPLGETGPGVLESVKAPPTHVLINKLPLTDAPDAWTVENHVTSACPYRLMNRKKVMDYFESRGYRLLDSWDVPEISIDIPFYPERRLQALEGVYFRLET